MPNEYFCAAACLVFLNTLICIYHTQENAEACLMTKLCGVQMHCWNMTNRVLAIMVALLSIQNYAVTATTNQFGTNRKPPTNRLPNARDIGNSCLATLSTRLWGATADDCRCECESVWVCVYMPRGVYVRLGVYLGLAGDVLLPTAYPRGISTSKLFIMPSPLVTHFGFNATNKTKTKTLRQVNIFGFDFNMPAMD